jgi:hypothetical protein
MRGELINKCGLSCSWGASNSDDMRPVAGRFLFKKLRLKRAGTGRPIFTERNEPAHRSVIMVADKGDEFFV